MKRLLTLILFVAMALGCAAQTDTEFWFAAPDLDINHAQEPIRFCIVSYDEATTVVFEQPANPNYAQRSFQLSANDVYVYDVSSIIGMVETQPYNTVLNYGFYIHSDHPVSIYYESDNNNSEIYSLKGKNALGTSFVVPMQYTYENYYSSTCSRIEVVATQDGTEVTFVPSVPIKGGGQAGVPVTVTLGRGQSYAIEAASPQGSAHLRNTRVTASKPIAVNTSDDSVNLNGHYDLVGDQIVPVDLLSTDYIAIWNNNYEEYLYFFPTEDNTSFYLNGSSVPLVTLNVGEEYTHRITSAVAYVHADRPVAVFQMSSSYLSEFGGTVLPQISCTGSLKTVYKRQNTSNLVVTLIVGSSHTGSFVLNGSSTYITASDFTPVPGNADYSYCRKDVTAYVPTNGLMSIENTDADGYFHLGILTGEDGTWNYGYFSDYHPYAFADFLMDDTYCSGQDIEFYYSTENVANLRLVLPDGTETQLPYVLHNAQAEQSGRYALRGEDCNGVRELDAIDINISESTEATIELEGCTLVTWHGLVFDHSTDTTWMVPGAGQNDCDSIYTLNVTVYPPNDTTVIDASICVGQTYNFHGTLYDQDGQVAYFDIIDHHGCLKVEKLMLSVDEYQMPPVQYQYECYEQGTTPSWTWDKTGETYHEDTVDEIILPDPNGGCDIRYRLDLRFHEEFYEEQNKVACDFYTWPVNGQTYTTSQIAVVESFTTEFGDTQCDSTYVLHLEISDYETNDFTVEDDENCDQYFWDPQGKPFTTEDEYAPEDNIYTQSGTYHRTYHNQMGCDSIVTMSVQFDYSPSPTPIYPMDSANIAPHWVVTATEFQINAYDFQLWDINPLCRWDTVTWSLEGPVEWVLEPFGSKGKCCKVYVLDQTTDTIWLKARVYNRCAPDDGVTQKYWLVCSFYGLDEREDNRADFSVIPNPNNGQMEILLEHLTGKITVKVYDVKGNLIDGFQTYNNSEFDTMSYHLERCAGGIYFFVATGKEGTVSKKVIINR